MPISTAGTKGFSLLELLVTLAVVAMIAALAGPSLASRLMEDPAARSARLVKGLLEGAAATAASRGAPVLVTWDGARAFQLEVVEDPDRDFVARDGGRGAAAARTSVRILEIPPEVEIVVRGPADGQGYGIAFFAVGGSSGGEIALRSGTKRLVLQVEPLSGRVRYAPAAKG